MVVSNCIPGSAECQAASAIQSITSLALKAVKELFEDRIFGNAADEVVIEDFLFGQEASVFALTDGKDYRLFLPAQDHKRIGNGDSFLFYRDYMDYHRDRFADHSLMVYRGGKLVALLPANRAADGTLISHEGLTYGGLVVSRSTTLHDVLVCFHACLRHLHERQIPTLRYKRIPGFYNTLPDDEVAYALFLLEARLYRRDCAVVVSQADRLPFEERRRRQIKKAGGFNVRIVQEKNYSAFWERVLVPRLAARHGIKPVHSIEEITLLASHFPENIRQFSVYCDDEIVAGATIYETPTVAHAQYIGATDKGQKIGALDYLFGWLLDEFYRGKRYFDFGICNEQEGRLLNHGLQDWKEGFGGRCYAHDFYEIATANYSKLESVLPPVQAKS